MCACCAKAVPASPSSQSPLASQLLPTRTKRRRMQPKVRSLARYSTQAEEACGPSRIGEVKRGGIVQRRCIRERPRDRLPLVLDQLGPSLEIEIRQRALLEGHCLHPTRAALDARERQIEPSAELN